MNWAKPIFRTLLALTLSGTGVAFAAGQRVTGVMEDTVSTYAQKSDYFVKGQTLSSSAIRLPLPVLEENAKGYVKVSLQGKEVWFDLMDITLYPPKSSGATGCVPIRYQAKAGVSRGAGEGCK